MRAATKALMISNARGGNQGGNRGGRSEMEMGYGEMRRGYQGARNDAQNGSRGTLTWDTNEPENYGRSEMRNAAYGEMRGEYGRSEMDMGYGRTGMRRGGGRAEMRNEGGRSEVRNEGNMRQEMGGQNRIGYEGGGNARSEMDDMEARRRYRRDSRGRFRSEMDEEKEMGMHYPMPYPFPPPVYEEYGRNEGRGNPIGFSAEGGGAELHMIRGGANAVPQLDKETAHEWMESLQNEDGTKGPHWTMEQIKQLMAQKGWQEDPIRAWVAMNIMYSDYCGAAKKVNANNIDFYIAMAKAFLGDKDAVKDKLAAYYEYIVK